MVAYSVSVYIVFVTKGFEHMNQLHVKNNPLNVVFFSTINAGASINESK